jgi:oligoribonuclease NrnB/cAMP/cGMP phosphodiesterase (DHH superfamily)
MPWGYELRKDVAPFSFQNSRDKIMHPIVIYHGNCADGFTAAWVVRKHYLREIEESSEDFPVFYAATYNNPVPTDVTGREVIMVDFSYKRDVMEKICRRASSVLVIDHHKTAEEALKGLDKREFRDVKLYFDMEHSGAMLAWFYYFGDTPPPNGLKHVEDRDLWKFNLFGTRQYNANLFSYPYTWENWDRLINEPTDQAIREGAAIERKHFKDIEELIPIVTRRMVIPCCDGDGEYRFHHVEIPVANVPYTLGSDVGNILAKRELEAGRVPIAGYYYDTPEGRNFGFRSIGDVDCSLLAKALGGGGHRNASGANKIRASVFEKFETDLDTSPYFDRERN